jgi:inner membrane transporter RhtA
VSVRTPVLLVVVGIVSVQLGAAFAKDLFDLAAPTTMTWLRLLTSAVLLWAVARPRLSGHDSNDWRVAVGFGLALGLMNWAIYQSFARIPLGVAVSIEFIGPLGLAVLSSRRARDLLWVGLAAVGVGLLGLHRATLDAVGVGYAVLAGLSWAAYILLSQRTGARWRGLDGLAVASVVASLAITPLVLLGADARVAGWDPGLGEPRVWVLGALIGVLSSVIPYSCELVALRSLKPAVFSILMSLEPAAAALAAVLVLHELLAVGQWLAIACVVAASIGATRSAGGSVPTPLGDIQPNV